jgi:hypothetical protein
MEDFEVGFLRRLNQAQTFGSSSHYHMVFGFHRNSGLSIQS